MNRKPCPLLDDYLAGDLAQPERSAFAEHLPECPACADAVRRHERLAGLLRQAIAQAEVPASLASRCRQRVQRYQRRRVLAWTGAACVAASLLLWVGLHNFGTDERPATPAGSSVAKEKTQRIAVDRFATAPQSRVSIDPQSGFLAVPQTTDHPNVTLLWLYPIVNTAASSEKSPPAATSERSDL